MNKDAHAGFDGRRSRVMHAVAVTRSGFRRGLILLVAACAWTSVSAGPALPLGFTPTATPCNFQSQRGVPISSISNNPVGSDGRLPIGQNESGTFNAATTNQFRSLTSFGAGTGLGSNDWRSVSNSVILKAGVTAFSAALAVEMKLPLARVSNEFSDVAVIQRQAQIGAPFLCRMTTLSFGSVITVPETDEKGILLPAGTSPAYYWLAEPYTTNDHKNAGYYWSPNANVVYATQPGPVAVTWMKATPYTAASAPAYTNINGTTSFYTNGDSVYLLYTVRYIVSSSVVKTPRKMYWTEGAFQNIGKPVRIDPTRVPGGVNIVYNSDFPETVSSMYAPTGQSGGDDATYINPTNALKTLFYSTADNYLHAYNAEGRVFVELLGDIRGDKTHESLGFEIVDVSQQPVPLDVTTELGEQLQPPDGRALDQVSPDLVNKGAITSFTYEHKVNGSDQSELFATKVTANVNDCLVYWMEAGVQGLLWPASLGRYALVWPSDPGRYSHYIRPAVATEADAMKTAVALKPETIPTIVYQDPLDRPRAKLTAEFKFYTYLTTDYPAHRTLLQFTSGDNVAFERVFSWLDSSLRTTNFAGSAIAMSLPAVSNYVASMIGGSTTSNLWPDELAAPRVVSQAAYVGSRITAPDGELGSDSYLAGYINTNVGTLYNPDAYIDPLASGFATANLGAIIPVNDAPGKNQLEVWWFRANDQGTVGYNAGDTELGFATVYWPSVIGRYTLAWPADAREIVLASNLGSGTLDAFESQGAIYYQNATNLLGYNPNEEHAIMSGGIAYATRDDLNVTNGPSYSSPPFVLVEYMAQDGRPALSVFRVRREKPDAGYVFDYLVAAGQRLQAPMPLPLLSKPVEGSGDSAISYNAEPVLTGGDLPGAWNPAADPVGVYSNYAKFSWQDRNQDIWVYRGLHAGPPALLAGTYNTNLNVFAAPVSNAIAVVNQPFSFTLHASRAAGALVLTLTNAPGAAAVPLWLQTCGLSLTGTPVSAGTTNSLQVIVSDPDDGSSVTNALTLVVTASGSVVAQAPLVITSSNAYTHSVVLFSNRPPFLAQSPSPANSFTMRYYYKTDASFAWPGLANPPPVGSIVPYLRPVDGGAPVGDPASKTTASLDIVYRPYWPAGVPTLPYAYTLAAAALGLPGVRDWKSAQILYQQSVAANVRSANVSAVLFDPTREKVADLLAKGLTALPGGVASTYYQGKVYFQNLPPHLATRLCMDPARGTNGSLVLTGSYVEQALGASYFQLNVLRDADLATVIALCPSNDTAFAMWSALVNGLAATVETFHENPVCPGTYVADPARTASVGVGDVVEVNNANTMVDSYALSTTGPGNGYVTLIENGGAARTQAGDPVALHIIKTGGALYTGDLVVMPAPNPLSEQVTFQHSADLAGRFAEYEYEWKIAGPVDGQAPAVDATMSAYLPLVSGINLPRYTLGGAGIQALCDNHIVMRFRPVTPTHPLYHQWSDWTSPALCEGWIKRVLAGINPFTQRTTDLFNNTVNTDVSMLTQAGHRWEGDVALNADTLNDHGLIEIYETVLRRGRMLSIEAGYNYGPANDALLLVSGYLNDLYMMVGNEAWADAANPTIGIGTSDKTYGDVATALFAFKGQTSSLLEEELALLRGRDDFLEPGVDVAPVYNRLVWNYTRGIDAGEVIYALNYDIQENPNKSSKGYIDASDAAYMFPQGHGDAYGHYLTALAGYYSLLVNNCFDWVPRIEAVNILGKPVSVDYQDERKFAAAAVSLARAGQQIMDLTWRRDFASVAVNGWTHLAPVQSNSQTGRTEYWGLDHWATRTGQGNYLNWVVGNAILPDVDPDPTHQGIQKIDRTTVPELTELASLAGDVQTDLDNAEGGLTPLGMPEGAIAFDIDPTVVVGTDNGTHFEQIYSRAKTALNNAVVSFDDAKDVTQLMRQEQDSLTDFETQVAKQEQAYNNALIEQYGSPYPDDIGAGKTFAQGYSGPDLLHYAYVDLPEYSHPELVNTQTVFRVDTQQFPTNWSATSTTFDFVNNNQSVTYNIGANGFLSKPSTWTGVRASPGKIQQAISGYISAYDSLQQALADAEGAKQSLDQAIQVFSADVQAYNAIRGIEAGKLAAEQTLGSILTADNIVEAVIESTESAITDAATAIGDSIPTDWTDWLAPLRGAAKFGTLGMIASLNSAKIADKSVALLLQEATADTERWTDFNNVAPLEWQTELRGRVTTLAGMLGDVQGKVSAINTCARQLDDAQANVRAAVAAGERIQAERETFRRRSAVVVQGYRTRDAAFRLFRNEKLERYKTLFDLAARYAYLAANAYDYETGLLNTPAGQSFINRIVSARALGVVKNGEPQYAGSDTGDPGLSSALAEMKADWDVLRGRLGFNNPDAYGTTVSLRWEGLRISPETDGDTNWRDYLATCRMKNILDDADVRHSCMQIDDGSGLPVPGIVLTFKTTITDGYNLLGQELSAGDHCFSSSSFATKIFAAGVALTGYRGMDNPSTTSGAGGTSPADPSTWYLDPLALAATPYVYLIPCGSDAMRSPPLGDTSTIRTWTVNDVAIPMPFNIGASDFSSKALWQSSDSLTEALFSIRKHQAFRPVSTTSVFSPSLYGSSGTLQRSQYMNNRLVGRSVWNTQWKLVIPGKTLLNDPNTGLDHFIQTVTDAKIYFVTYSYSGN